MCMRKFQNFAFAGAIALAGVAGLTACSSDDAAEAPLNPTFDGESVKTAFAINVAAPSKGGTRMDGNNTQQGDTWRYLKMSNIYLMALSSTPANGEAINLLTNLADPTSVTTDRSSHIYKNISIPVGTSDFLFYATRGGAATSSVDEKFEKGVINSSLYNTNNTPISTPSEINFSLEKVVANLSTFNSRGTNIVAYLNSVASVADWSSTTDAVLKDAFDTFTATASNRSCSSFGLRRMMSDLYNVVNARSNATNIGSDVQALATNIKDAILNTSGQNIHFKVSNTPTPSDGCTLEYFNSSDYDNFPAAFNLPEGAAQYSCTNGQANRFVFTSSATVGETNTVDVANVSYPACIAYYVNTPAKASDKEIQDTEWKTTPSQWNTAFDGSDWYDEVVPATRSIALKNNINYGVACLATTVKCANVILKDNAIAVATADADNDVNIGSGFKVTGILIGGQPGQVGWQYVNTTADERTAVVYDKSLTSITANTTGSSINYTLLFDNYKVGGTQENVNVAIELVNDKQDFYGVNGIIPKGQKFYLVGQLTLGATGNISGSTTPKWPKYGTEADNLPTSYEGRYPAMAGDAGQAINRVFVQDYTTTANFTIKDLKKAYVTIPDLRASQLQLGLSVDLKWQTGLTFDVNL